MDPHVHIGKRQAVLAYDVSLSMHLKAWHNSSVLEHLTYKVRGHGFNSLLVQLFSRNFNCHLSTTISYFDNFFHLFFN